MNGSTTYFDGESLIQSACQAASGATILRTSPGSVAAANIAGWGLQVSARDAARFGHLFLNRGQWDDQQLISTEWVDEATRVQVPNSRQHTRTAQGESDPAFMATTGGAMETFRMVVDLSRMLRRTHTSRLGLATIRFGVVPEWNMVIVKTADDPRDELLWNAFYRQIGKSLVPEIDGANFD